MDKYSVDIFAELTILIIEDIGSNFSELGHAAKIYKS